MFPTYSRMKDSGVKWLGRVPDNWRVKRLKDVVLVNAEALPETTDPEMVIQYVDIGNVQEGEDAGTPQEVTFFNAPSRARRIVRTGDTIISTVRTYLKAVAHFEDPPGNLIASTGFAVLSPGRDLAKRFLFYLVRSEEFIQRVVAHSVGVSYPAINQSELAGLPVWIPSFSEQESIAFFLDHKTALIDRLIAKRERQIELLQEHRAALISRAVTKGLNPNVPMKDSGVEWVGEIPNHWKVIKLKFITQEVTVGIVITPARYYVDAGVPCLRSLNVREGKLLDSDLVSISQESNVLHRKSMIFSGDLVAVRTGQPGTTAVVDGRFDGANCIDLIIIRRSGKYFSPFLEYQCNSLVAKIQFGIGAGGAIQQHFNVEAAKNLLVVYPPYGEQEAIASFLDRETAKIDTFVTKVRESIDKLKEYRQSLISATVTGKIDVREWMDRRISEKEPKEVYS